LRSIVILLVEENDNETERILAALSQGGPPCVLRRARAWDAFAAALVEEPPDLVIAGGAPPPLDARAIVEVAAAGSAGVPVVVVAHDARAEHAVELLGQGAAGYVPGYRLEQLGGAVARAIDGAERAEVRRSEEAAQRFLNEAGAALASSLPFEEALARVARAAVPAAADVCWIGVDAGAGPPLAITRAKGELLDTARLLSTRATPPIPSASVAAGRAELCESMDDALLAARARDGRHLGLLRDLGLVSFVSAPLLAGERVIGAITLGTADASRRPRAAHAACLADLGRRAGAAVEQAVRYREAVDAGKRKDELLARVAHELRTPLNAMLGWASMLRTRRLDEAARTRALETIERNARTEARLIEDLLDVSRMLTRSLRIEIRELDVRPTIAAAVEASRPSADAKGVALTASLPDDIGTIAGDAARLRQVVEELIANAVRATPPHGHVWVRLSRAGEQAEVVVSDDGRGIRAELLPRVFEGFPRAGPARNGSLGMGLALAHHLVGAHGGTLTAESLGEGRGATFTVRLPRCTARPPSLAASEGARSSRGLWVGEEEPLSSRAS
jgi:signal transduction histidine kinase